MWKAKLRWFEHVKRICSNALVQRCERLTIDIFKRNKGKPKKYLEK